MASSAAGRREKPGIKGHCILQKYLLDCWEQGWGGVPGGKDIIGSRPGDLITVPSSSLISDLFLLSLTVGKVITELYVCMTTLAHFGLSSGLNSYGNRNAF